MDQAVAVDLVVVDQADLIARLPGAEVVPPSEVHASLTLNHNMKFARLNSINTGWALALVGAMTFSTLTQAQDPPPGGRGGRVGRGGGSGGMLATQMIAQGDKNADQKLSKEEMSALADAWFDKLDPNKTGKLTQEQFTSGFGELLPAPQNPTGGAPLGGGRGPGGGRGGRGPSGMIGSGLFTATDTDKDGSVTRAEFKSTFEKWAVAFDTDKSGALTQEKLVAGLNGVFPRPGPGGGRGAAQPDDNTGFTAIFDGKSLEGWDGDPKFWRAENSEIIGESTAEKRVEQNTFLVWRGGITKDFEFKVDFKISDGSNSGVQYRSTVLSDVGKWVMKGYQADMDGANQFTGMIYEERGRGFLAPRGQFARVIGRGQTKLIGSVGESDALRAFIKQGDWNQLHIIARGNTIIQSINGHVMSALVDEDDQGRAMEGLLGLQIHVGPPMKLQFKNVLYKKL